MDQDLDNGPSSPENPRTGEQQPQAGQASGTRDKKRKTTEPPSPSENVRNIPGLHLPYGINSRKLFTSSMQKSPGRKTTLPDLQVVLKDQEAFGEAVQGMGKTRKDVKELVPSVARRLASTYRTLVDIGKKYLKESLERAEKVENRRLKERGETSSEQEFNVLAWLLNVKFIPDFPHDKPELLSHSQIRRNNDLAGSLGEVKVAFREIQPEGGRLEKCVYAGEWLSVSFLLWKKKKDADMSTTGSMLGSQWDMSFRALLRDTDISLKEITARKYLQVGELSWLLPKLRQADLTFHALTKLPLCCIIEFVEGGRSIQEWGLIWGIPPEDCE